VDQAPPGFHGIPGRSPDGIGECLFIVAKDELLAHFYATGNRSKLLESLLIPEVLQAPCGIWQDLKRPGQQSAFCYSGKPTARHVYDTSITVPCPPGQVFFVYVRIRATKRPGTLSNHEVAMGYRRLS
jgi:hypothetical protein